MGLIRFILACSVVLCHTSSINGFSPLWGDLAVQCFYIISGFYMSMVLNEKYYSPTSNKSFYINRALKIYPIYWIILILCIAWSCLVFKMGYPGVIKQYSSHWPLSTFTMIYLFFSNIFLIGLDWIVLFGIDNTGSLFFTDNFNETDPKLYNFAFNNIAWTVGAELMFYLIAPFILRKKIRIPVIILILSLMLRLLFIGKGMDYAPWNYMFFPTQLMFFMAGAVSYYLYKHIKLDSIRPIWLYLMYFSFLTFLVLYYEIGYESYVKQSILFVFTVLSIPIAFYITKKNKLDRYLGDLSYPIYISQALVIMITAPKIFPKPLGWGATSLLILVPLSMILHHFVTKPLEKHRVKRIANLKNGEVVLRTKEIINV